MIKKSYRKHFSEFYRITNHTNGGLGYTQQSSTPAPIRIQILTIAHALLHLTSYAGKDF